MATSIETVTVKRKPVQVINGILNLSGRHIHKISDIQGLEYLQTMHTLNLSDNKLRDIDGLSPLVNLQVLDLGDNKIKDMSPVYSLVNLKVLMMSDNKIKEIQGLDNLTRLEQLDLSKNSIKEIRGLQNLVNLKTINLDGNWMIKRDLLNSMGRNGRAYVDYCRMQMGLPALDMQAQPMQQAPPMQQARPPAPAPAQAVKRCPGCGVAVPNEAAFCPECGAKVE